MRDFSNRAQGIILTFLALLLVPLSASAATWHVEQDGSGDFTTIQAAVDAAEDGDVIAIGAGHYSETTEYQGWEVCVLLSEPKSLRFVGAGADVTIVGSESSQVEEGTYAFAFLRSDSVYDIAVADLRMVNSAWGLFASDVNVEIANCIVENCYYGIAVRNNVGSSLVVTDSTFFGEYFPGVPIGILTEAQWTLIERSEFLGWGEGIQLLNNYGADALIADCLVDGGILGKVGISMTDGPGGTIRDCTVRNQDNYGVALGGAGYATFLNNVFEHCGYAGFDLAGCTSLTMLDNVIQSSGSCFFIAITSDTQTIRNNHFLRDVANDGYYVKTPDQFPWGPFYEDFTYNYWGTTDVDEISLWILDGYDDPEDTGIYVVFEPMADGPVRVESRSWSGVRDLFQGDE